MLLALDCATDQASVALGQPGRVLSEAGLEGRRQHASGLLPLVHRLLEEQAGGVADLTGVLVTDGPGSFTGLRIGAALAKALVHNRDLELWSAPSLLVQAAAAVPGPTGTVLAVADALRGEVYAAMYRFQDGRAEVALDPLVYQPTELVAGVPRPDVIAGLLPPAMLATFEQWVSAGSKLVEARPTARLLLELMAHPGAVTRIAPELVGSWEPDYGRPAEAQSLWERTHGRPLPDPDRRV